MLLTALIASTILPRSSPPEQTQQTGKWGLVRKLEGHAAPAEDTYYGTHASATVSEGNFTYTDKPVKPNVFTSAEVTMTWTNAKSTLTPGETLEFNVTANAKVSEKDAQSMNITAWFVFNGGFKVLEEKNAFVGHYQGKFIGEAKGKFRVQVPEGREGVELHIWQGQTGLGWGYGGNFYPCQYWYKWNAKPIDSKPPKELEKKPEEEKKPEDEKKEEPTVLIGAADYRELCEKVSSDGEPPYSELIDGGHILHGVAADGTSLVLLRAGLKAEGQATFKVPSVGGGLSALTDSNLYRSKGSPTLTVNTVPVGGMHYAFALYRPPNTFGAGNGEKDLDFVVDFKMNDQEKYKDPKATTSIKLVRPPVVLVHGTYDNPRFCYQEHDDLDDAPMNLAPRLARAGFKDVFCVDWEETNGSKDPSSFVTNSKSVWQNVNGIQKALDSMRARYIAVTQADVVCHSQGGVITRVYARGYNLNDPLPACHLADPVNCKSESIACWYHRKDNHWSGDIHRLITISSTHRGSDVCRLFNAFGEFQPGLSPIQDINKLILNLFLVFVDKNISGITTQGFYNQTPDSRELQAIGATPVPSHAIACVATDEDMSKTRPDGLDITMGMGNYYGKLYKIWKLTPYDTQQWAFDYLGEQAAKRGDPKPKANAAEFARLSKKLQDFRNRRTGPEDQFKDLPDGQKLLDDVIYHMRKTVFLDDENDCTVSMTSSYGGLKSPFTTKAEHVLHGWAPRYRVVQDRVIELLRNDGSLFDANGFPSYDGKQSSASTFLGNAANPPTTYLISKTVDAELATKGFKGGTFKTFFGNWVFTVEGTKVKGTLAGTKERIEGTLTGSTLKFQMTFADDAKTEGEITFTEDWNSFNGYFRDPDSTKWEFTGTRK